MSLNKSEIDKSFDSMLVDIRELFKAAYKLKGATQEEVDRLSALIPPAVPRRSDDRRGSALYVPKHPWSHSSRLKLSTCRPELIFIANCLADIIDVTVLDGYRDEEQQTKVHADEAGLPWPQSKHNVMPSMAIDLAPYPVDWRNLHRFEEMIGMIKAIVAQQEGITVRYGRDFSNVVDYPHIELVPNPSQNGS